MIGVGTIQYIECECCGVCFSPHRSTRCDHYDSKRCPKCGESHTPFDIQEYSDDQLVGQDDKKLYLFLCGELFKIGISKNPKRRKKQLQNPASGEIEIVEVWDVPNAARAEKKIHKRLIDKSAGGEWFEADNTSVHSIKDAISLFLDSEDFDGGASA